MNFSVDDRGQGFLVYVQEFGVWRQATPSECAQALSGAIEAEREACALVERLRDPFRNADALDWDHLFRMLPNSGHGQFWKAVMTEVREALATSK